MYAERAQVNCEATCCYSDERAARRERVGTAVRRQRERRRGDNVRKPGREEDVQQRRTATLPWTWTGSYFFAGFERSLKR
ncbi:hypothetical protein LDENG_00246140 [Lucifuga dentata]|nr:hypothetical protein LDENG_00246140 [Lucifuga dentata]